MYNVKKIRNTQHWRQSGKNYIIVRIQTSMLQIELTFFLHSLTFTSSPAPPPRRTGILQTLHDWRWCRIKCWKKWGCNGTIIRNTSNHVVIPPLCCKSMTNTVKVALTMKVETSGRQGGGGEHGCLAAVPSGELSGDGLSNNDLNLKLGV